MDTSIIGLFIGAFGISTGLWVGRRIKKEYVKFQAFLIGMISFFLTILPLAKLTGETIYFPVLLFGNAGDLMNKVYWVNKIIFGGIVGGIAGLLAYGLHEWVKRKRGKVLFPYQGIAFTMALLLLGGAALYLNAGGG